MQKINLEGTRGFRAQRDYSEAQGHARHVDSNGRCICGATSSRTGKPCSLSPIPGRTRCKWHGGKSTGPRTEAGKAQSRLNGSKGGRPRKHPLPVAAVQPETVAAIGEVSVRVQAGRCRDCRNLSAGYTCLPAIRGELGPGAEIRPAMAVVRHCSLFTSLLVADQPQ